MATSIATQAVAGAIHALAESSAPRIKFAILIGIPTVSKNFDKKFGSWLRTFSARVLPVLLSSLLNRNPAMTAVKIGG
jgi:hypothetical protein